MKGFAFPTLLASQSDDRLVALVRGGSDPAFAAIVGRYRAQLVRYSSRFVDPDRAEDVVQQALINTLRVLRSDERAIALRPWLYRLCHNLAVNERKRCATTYVQLDEDLDGVAQPPEIVERRLQLAELVAHWSALPARQRQALTAYELEGRDYAEIAAAMQTGEAVIRGLLARARGRLREVCRAVVPFPLVRHMATASAERSSVVELGAGAGGVGMAAKAVVAVVATAATLVATHAAVNQAQSSQSGPQNTDAQASTASSPQPSASPFAPDISRPGTITDPFAAGPARSPVAQSARPVTAAAALAPSPNHEPSNLPDQAPVDSANTSSPADAGPTPDQPLDAMPANDPAPPDAPEAEPVDTTPPPPDPGLESPAADAPLPA